MTNLFKLSWSLFGTLACAVIQIIQLSVVARFLDSKDFGLFAICSIIIGVGRVFSESGIGNAVITFKDFSKDKTSSILVFNFSLSLFVVVLVFCVTPFISKYYNIYELTNAVYVGSLSIPFFALARVMESFLQRDLMIREAVISSIIARLVSLLVAVSCAYYRADVYALVYSTIVLAVIQFGINAVYSKKLISFVNGVRFKHVKPLLRFSLFQLGELLLNYFSRNLDVVILTKILGSDVAGAYSVLRDLMMRIGDIILIGVNRLYYPLLSKEINNLNILRFRFKGFQITTALLLLMCYSSVSVNGELFISLFLGEKFTSLSGLMSLISIWLLLRYLTAPVSTLWLALNKPEFGFYWNVLNSFMTPLTIYYFNGQDIANLLFGFIFLQVFFYVISIMIIYKLLPGDFDIVHLNVFLSISSVIFFYLSVFVVSVLSLVGFERLILSMIISSVIMLFMYNKKDLLI